MTPLIDIVFLGQTVPESRRRDESIIQVCSIGYSPTLRSLYRIYPLPVKFGGQRWNKFLVPVERNPQDSRRESLRVASPHRRADLSMVPESMKFVERVNRDDTMEALERMAVSSIDYLNSERRSLGLLRPDGIRGYWTDNPGHAPLLESCGLFAGPARNITRRGYSHFARVCFRDGDGERDLMLNAWDAYEWYRRHGDSHALSSIWDRYCFGRDDYEHLLLVGNMNGHRNVWLVVAVLALKRRAAQAALPLFDEPSLFDAHGAAP